MATLKVNRLPAPTFSWLHVNHAEITAPQLVIEQPEIAAPEGITVGQTALQNLNIPQTDSEELLSFFTQNRVSCITLSGSSREPVRLQFQKNGISALHVNAEKGKQITVIADYRACGAFQTVIHAEDSASVKLVQIFSGSEAVSSIAAEIADCAELQLVQIFLSGASVTNGQTVTMNGRKSAFTANIGYIADHNDKLDLNMNIIQNGKQSESNVQVKGVLRGNASKVFRGTIDFRHGAVGARGAENEDVLLMNEHVQNRTVPVILCAEEDVSGSHGASIGQISAEHIFYLQSRGIPEERIAELMAQARLGSVIRQIGDAETEHRIFRVLGREEPDEFEYNQV